MTAAIAPAGVMMAAVLAGSVAVASAAVVLGYRRTGLVHFHLAALFLLGAVVAARWLDGGQGAITQLVTLALVLAGAALIGGVAWSWVLQSGRSPLQPLSQVGALGVACIVLAIAAAVDPAPSFRPIIDPGRAAMVVTAGPRDGVGPLLALAIVVAIAVGLAFLLRRPLQRPAAIAWVSLLAAAAGLAFGWVAGSGESAYQVMVLPLLAAVIGGVQNLRVTVWAAGGLGVLYSLGAAHWTIPVALLVALVVTAKRGGRVARL